MAGKHPQIYVLGYYLFLEVFFLDLQHSRKLFTSQNGYFSGTNILASIFAPNGGNWLFSVLLLDVVYEVADKYDQIVQFPTTFKEENLPSRDLKTPKCFNVLTSAGIELQVLI